MPPPVKRKGFIFAYGCYKSLNRSLRFARSLSHDPSVGSPTQNCVREARCKCIATYRIRMKSVEFLQPCSIE